MKKKNTIAHVPFNGDPLIGVELRELITEFNVSHIIETGTWSAHTTREFRKMVTGRVITIDTTHEHLLDEFGPTAVEDLKALKIEPWLADSGKNIYKALCAVCPLRGYDDTERCLIYLDAHGGHENPNPLFDELEAIFKWADEVYNSKPPVIAIHDFFVPGKPWGYNCGDWGDGCEPLSWKVIEKLTGRIYYGVGLEFYYNQEAEGCQRGIIYIHPRRATCDGLGRRGEK